MVTYAKSRADADRIREKMTKAGRLPLPTRCDCGGALYLDHNVETTTGRTVPWMAVCDVCFDTTEIHLSTLSTNGAT